MLKILFFFFFFSSLYSDFGFLESFPPGTITGKLGAVLAFVNKRPWHFRDRGRLHVPWFTGCMCCPEVAQNISSGALNGFAFQQSRMICKLFIFFRLFSFPTTNACCIISVDIAMWERNFYRGRIDSFLVFFCYNRFIVSHHHRAQHWQLQAPDWCLK